MIEHKIFCFHKKHLYDIKNIIMLILTFDHNHVDINSTDVGLR